MQHHHCCIANTGISIHSQIPLRILLPSECSLGCSSSCLSQEPSSTLILLHLQALYSIINHYHYHYHQFFSINCLILNYEFIMQEHQDNYSSFRAQYIIFPLTILNLFSFSLYTHEIISSYKEYYYNQLVYIKILNIKTLITELNNLYIQ